MVSLQQMYHCLQYGQPGSLERLAYWLDIDCSPSDHHAYLALLEYYELLGELPEKKIEDIVL